MKRFINLQLLIAVSISLYSQNGYKIIRTKLPFSTVEKDYYVKQIGNNYVLNGDIIVGNAGQSLMLYQGNNHNGAYIWPKGYVPVKIDASMKNKMTDYNKDMYHNALEAIREINSKTNIRLVPYTNEKDYIRIMYTSDRGYGGVSPLGRKGEEQILYITRESAVSTIIHEMMHSLGFWHEQSRYDRDQYVTIDTLNVKQGFRHNFQIEPGTPTSGYDYNSIMHYSAKAFAMDEKKPTIRCKNGTRVYDCSLGSEYFSEKDISGINASYWFNKDVAKRDYAAELPYDDYLPMAKNVLKTKATDIQNQKGTRVIEKPIENGIYMIKILGTSIDGATKYLDIAGVSKDNGAALQQWDKAGGDNQKFVVMSLENNLYLIKAVHSNKYLNVTGQSKEFRAGISQSDYLNQDNFKFYIRYQAGKKAYTIQSLQSEMFFTVLGLNNGMPLVQEPDLPEYFEFERVRDIPSIVKPVEKIKVAAPVRKLNTIKNQ